MSTSTVSFSLDQLARLIVALFTADELRHMLAHWPAGRPLARDVDVALAAPALAEAAAQEMMGQGLVDACFLYLQEKRPFRRADIDALHRRWLLSRHSEVDMAIAPLPLSAEMDRIQHFSEGDETVSHKDTTALHLLHGLLAVSAAYDVQARLRRLIDPDPLARALKSLARAETDGIPDGTRITRQGYDRLWSQAHEIARRRDGVALQYPDMLMAVCTLRPSGIGDYLQSIGVSWEAFEAAVFVQRPADGATPDAYGTEAERAAYYREVFDQLVDLKRAHGERVDNWSFPKFVTKLSTNTAELMKTPEAVDVRFVPYVEDGRVGLRATVVRA